MMQVRPRMRLARRRGHRLEYPGHLERDITTTLPGKPAALHVYDVRGRCTMLVLDLDAHERTHAQIARAQADYQAITSLLARMGARYVSDHAHGGRHIYIPLQVPLTQGQAALIVQALAKRYPSLDAGPHLNASDGLITIPGSAHKHGGHRVLDGSLAAAEAVFTHRTPPRVLEA
ncbi:MarR family transcriptional regulator, partial [Dermabacteraceae bacterium P13147]